MSKINVSVLFVENYIDPR